MRVAEVGRVSARRAGQTMRSNETTIKVFILFNKRFRAYYQSETVWVKSRSEARRLRHFDKELVLSLIKAGVLLYRGEPVRVEDVVEEVVLE